MNSPKDIRAKMLRDARDFKLAGLSRVRLLDHYWIVIQQNPILMGFFSIVSEKYFGTKSWFPVWWLENGNTIPAMKYNHPTQSNAQSVVYTANANASACLYFASTGANQ